MGFSENFIKEILFQGRAGHRLLNENAVQISVWIEFAKNPTKIVDVLLTPHDDTAAATLAKYIFDRLQEQKLSYASLTPVEGSVAVKLDLKGFLRVILPASGFDLKASLDELHRVVLVSRSPLSGDHLENHQISLGELIRFAGLSAGTLKPDLRTALVAGLLLASPQLSEGTDIDVGNREPYPELEKIVALPNEVYLMGAIDSVSSPPKIWRVAANRLISLLGVSIETIKADAAKRVFDVDCGSVTWAVIDSGIDGSHPAFLDHRAGDHTIRVQKAYDFTKIRQLASYDTLSSPNTRRASAAIVAQKLQISEVDALNWLNRLHDDVKEGRPYNWEALSRLLEVPPDKLTADNNQKVESHGTHVAGVLAGDWREGDHVVYQGVCPNLRLYDLRILGESPESTEFAVISALAFVRWLNARNRYMVIHGINLSIGLAHDKTQDACGCTPVCMACDATVSSGVTVVAAAGNNGSFSYQTEQGYYDGYTTVSIADPGNTESVITVGSTHRERPHEYGISFFSSRGPTGDGRAKPDVVAPGERIDGPLPNLGYGKLDGTSMAAPHVSGVAALLLARNPELIGKPGRVKAIIVKSATDLGRERNFQGAGLVDALRALQSI